MREKLTPPALGEIVPDFSFEATSGLRGTLADFRGTLLVLYFYPRDDTPGCTVEGQDFTRLQGEFEACGAKVFGLSRESLRKHENFRRKAELSVDLIADPEERLCSLFDVMREKKLYGKAYIGIDRSTFLIDRTGRLAREWRGVQVPGHAEAVLGAVRELADTQN